MNLIHRKFSVTGNRIWGNSVHCKNNFVHCKNGWVMIRNGIAIFLCCPDYIDILPVKLDIKASVDPPLVRRNRAILVITSHIWQWEPGLPNMRGNGGTPSQNSVPPIRSSFPDYGLDPDFFEEIGLDLGWKVSFFVKMTVQTTSEALN